MRPNTEFGIPLVEEGNKLKRTDNTGEEEDHGPQVQEEDEQVEGNGKDSAQEGPVAN